MAGPDIVTRGFVYVRDSEELLADARERVLESFHGLHGHGGSDWSFVKDKIKHTLSEFLYERTHRCPMILPVVMEV
jgi:ribonuclease J